MKLENIKSIHFVPANKTHYLEKILKHNEKPDALIFDLEDSVKPDAKDSARENLVKMFEDYKEELRNFTILIRPNKENTPFYKKDTEIIKQLNPDFIVLSKVESKKEIKRGKKIFYRPVIVAIETILGIENSEEILSSLSDEDAVVVGYEDLSAELGIERPRDLFTVNPLTHNIFNVYTKARKYDIPILDAVCRYYKQEDLEIMKNECEFTSNLRFTGKFTIHSNQISIANEYFDKSKIKDFANDVVKKFYDIDDGSAVIVKDKQMMDTPSLKLYKKYKENDK